MKKDSVFIIAELSANHAQDYDLAIKTIDAIKDSGADAVKLQTYTADTITLDCDNDYFQIKHGTLWDGTTLHKLYQEAFTPWEWHEPLKEYADKLGLICFSSPFDKTAVDFLESLNMPAYKIASFELGDIPLIEYTASKGKPMIMSTGIATISEIQDAVEACKRSGNDDITLLKCTSSYPAPIEEANLMTMVNMKETFGVKVGLSDHTMVNDVTVAAVALGATVIEKHFILDRKNGGPDAAFSIEPEQFRQMVNSIRNVEKAKGSINYQLTDRIIKNREFKRSLFIVEDIKKGEKFTNENVRSIRPGAGLSPRFLSDIIGRAAESDLKRGQPLMWKNIR